jgi:hypothetical protein
MSPRTSVISDSKPAGRSRNISSAASPYRSLSNGPIDEDAAGSHGNNGPVDSRLGTLYAEPATNDGTGDGQAQQEGKSSGFARDSSQQSPSTTGSPDASPKGEASSKAADVTDPLISSRPASQQQHENSTNQSGSSQPPFSSFPADRAVSSANTTRSSSETQSSSRGLPIDLTESGKLNSQAVGPVKEISIRVEAPSGEVVHLKVVDQVNQVQIGVRSSNAALATNLRQDLSSLTATLDRLGWKSEPASVPTLVGVATTAEGGSGSNDQSDSSRSQTAAEWWNNPEQNRRSTSELWEEALNRRTP